MLTSLWMPWISKVRRCVLFQSLADNMTTETYKIVVDNVMKFLCEVVNMLDCKSSPRPSILKSVSNFAPNPHVTSAAPGAHAKINKVFTSEKALSFIGNEDLLLDPAYQRVCRTSHQTVCGR